MGYYQTFDESGAPAATTPDGGSPTSTYGFNNLEGGWPYTIYGGTVAADGGGA